jgi:small-conductance mechanosensitive channel
MKDTLFLQFVSSNRIVLILLVLGVSWLMTRLTRLFLNRMAELYSSRRILIKTFIPLMNIVVNIAAILVILFGILRISSDVLLTFGVSAGVAIGFAVQDILANIFGGLVIIFTRPFNIGDKISVGEYYGEVIDVSLSRVKIVTSDDSTINIPSKMFLQQTVSNANSGELNCQVVTEMFFDPESDTAELRRIARDAVFSSPFLLPSKPVVINFSDYINVNRYLKIKIKAYVFDHRYEFRFSSDITERILMHVSSAVQIKKAGS